MTEYRDVCGNRIAKKLGDRILDNYGNWVYEIRGDPYLRYLRQLEIRA